jgi:hypothetical protein
MSAMIKARVAFLTRACTSLIAAALAFTPSSGWPETFVLTHSKVLWVRGDRIYVACPDGMTIDPTTKLTFRDRDKTVATGTVTSMIEGEFVVARLTWGSLDKVKRLDRLEITADPPEVRVPSLLRLGYPASGRGHPLVNCPHPLPDTTALQGAYKAETVDVRSIRLVRYSWHTLSPSWPDTLLIRFFDEIADQEIALERGDLDVAVFWPGEASPHIRGAMGWQTGPSGQRSERYLAVVPWYLGAPSNPPILSGQEKKIIGWLNGEMFRGDLHPTHEVWPSLKATGLPTRFEVDSSIPGHDSMERLLNGAIPSGARTAHIVRLDLRPVPPRGTTVADSVPSGYYVACPILSVQRHRRYVAGLDPDALVNLFQCPPAADPK